MLYIANTKEEVKKMFPDADLILEGYENETENKISHFYVYKNNQIIARVEKPREKSKIKQLLINGNFPTYFVEKIFNAKKTKVIKEILQAPENKGLVASGKAGIGKTFATIFKIAKLMKNYKINRPLYITLQDTNAYNLLYKERNLSQYDLILLDDLNKNLTKLEKKLAETIIFHTYNTQKKLYITTNQSLKELFKFIDEEPIKSRIMQTCTLLQLDGEDLRIKQI